MPKRETYRQPAPGIEERRQDDGTVSYRASVWDNRNRRRVRKTFPTLRAAKQWRTEALVAVRRGELHAQRSTPTVSEGLDALLEGMQDGQVRTRSGTPYKPGTIRTYRYAIRDWWTPRLGHLRLHEVQRRDVQAVIDRMHRDGCSASMIRNTIDPLRVMFRRAIRADLITRTPCEYLDVPAGRKAPRRAALKAEGVAQLLDALPDTDRALWATAFYAGLRRGELRALRWGDVDLDGSVIHVRRSWDDVEGEQAPKSFAGIRDVLVLPQLAQELARHGLDTGRTGDALVFGRTDSEPFARQTASRTARETWKAAKLEGVTLHHARHCAASFMVAAGLDVKSVQTYLGHSDSRITLDLYAHAIPDRHKRDAEQVAAFLRD